MSDWPPKPQQTSDSSGVQTGQEWVILEKAVMASVQEQRRARRWGIFFKCLSFAYLLFIIVLMARSCSTAEQNQSNVVTSAEHIAVVDVIGTIAADERSVNSINTNKALQRAFEASSSKAVVLNINSPGGSPVQSDEIWQKIRQLKKQYPQKKIYAVIGDIGASGAYYIASAADEIWVNPSSLVGSIGVIMPNYGLTGLADKLGVEDRTLTAGDNKDILSMTKPVDPVQRAHVQGVIDNVHQHFIQAVKQGRGTRLKANDPTLFSGLFWSGEQAIALGIADRSGSVDSLMQSLKVKQKVNYTIEQNALQSLLGNMGTHIGQGIGLALSKQVNAEQNPSLQ